jgi:hypothetical protein
MFRKSFLVLIALILAVPLYSQTVDDILAKSQKASGYDVHGKDLTSLKITGKMSMMGMDMDIIIFNKKPYFKRTEIDIMGSKMITACNETEGWAINPMAGSSKAEKLPDSIFQKTKDQNDFLSDKWGDYKAKGIKIELLGKETVNDKECYKLDVTSKAGDKSLVYLGTADYLPWMMKMNESQMGRDTEVEVYMSDYKNISGIMIPHTINTKAAGQEMKMTFEKVETNIPMGDDLFSMPK